MKTQIIGGLSRLVVKQVVTIAVSNVGGVVDGLNVLYIGVLVVVVGHNMYVNTLEY